MVLIYWLSYYISHWWNKIEADKSWLPSCQVWRGCQMCANVLAAQGLRLEGVEGQLWGSPGSYPSGLLARCGAGLHRRQRSLKKLISGLWTKYDNKKAFFDMTFWQHTSSVSGVTGTTLLCQDIKMGPLIKTCCDSPESCPLRLQTLVLSRFLLILLSWSSRWLRGMS